MTLVSLSPEPLRADRAPHDVTLVPLSPASCSLDAASPAGFWTHGFQCIQVRGRMGLGTPPAFFSLVLSTLQRSLGLLALSLGSAAPFNRLTPSPGLLASPQMCPQSPAQHWAQSPCSTALSWTRACLVHRPLPRYIPGQGHPQMCPAFAPQRSSTVHQDLPCPKPETRFHAPAASQPRAKAALGSCCKLNIRPISLTKL